jgi:hypothetical protein
MNRLLKGFLLEVEVCFENAKKDMIDSMGDCS